MDDAQLWGGTATLGAIGVSILCFVAVHLLPTGLNPVRDYVSQYHLTRYRPWIAISTLAAGVAGIAAIVALTAMVGEAAVVSDVLLGVFVLARLVIPFRRMDPPGTPTTSVGRLHNVLAFAAFGAAVAVGFTAGGALHDAGFPSLATASTICGAIGAVGAVGLLVGLLVRRRAAAGLFERVIYLGFFAWFVLLGMTAVTAG